MNLTDYEKLMAEIITPLDFPTLTRLKTDVAQLWQERQTQEPDQPNPLMELAAVAWESLKDVNAETYWAEREKELAESRASWAEKEMMLDRERGL
ncbi:MAG: hypothetical protein LBV79_01635 [Candidatus Adiutrix sp.]|jgi:hypothetical protein|nr:hypothetical protein [Candidatus Adiutrix sp.]